MRTSAPYAVVGGGAVGKLIAGRMHANGVPVVLVEPASEHLRALAAQPVKIVGDKPGVTYGIHAVGWDDAPHDPRGVLMCVKPKQVEDAMRSVLSTMDPHTPMVSFVGGVSGIDLIASWGGEQVFALLNSEAREIAPNRVEAAFSNFIWIGNQSSTLTPFLKTLQRDLSWVAPCLVTKVIWGMQWSKAAYAVEAGLPPLFEVAPLEFFADRDRRACAVALVREAVSVTRSAGITPVPFDFFDPNLYDATTPGEHTALHAWLQHSWQRHEMYRLGTVHEFPSTCGLGWSMSPDNPQEELTGIVEELVAAAAAASVPAPGIAHLLRTLRARIGGSPVDADAFVDRVLEEAVAA